MKVGDLVQAKAERVLRDYGDVGSPRHQELIQKTRDILGDGVITEVYADEFLRYEVYWRGNGRTDRLPAETIEPLENSNEGR
jgi:hypothetical protein